MQKDRKLISIVAVLFVFLCIQVPSSAWAEGSSPLKVVKNFAQAYFMLDPSMTEYLSKAALMTEGEVDTTKLYLEMKAAEAHNQGHNISYFRMHPIIIKTTVLSMDDSSAKVELTATTIRNINPLYRIVGFVFGLLQEHEVHGIIPVIKEDGEWKIGPGAIDMPQ
ncbi:MAG: hypothetical protein KKE44_21700 [Proteobacteria bacterium]|nr:hypothetical protein [Pseudomonadota bacterium]MBU1585350.1 hypothetical protein [Pseudomonadota bacterium]MBU2454628.1 hypothetical protein [Pseudomonadota bacterium]MBU2629823.1 hypothetical protein [Pseudomonadota bacterium]